MSYNNNRRGQHHDSTTHYYQRTIPEMLATRPDNHVSRSNKNVRFMELTSEHAVAPASPAMPTPNNSYYPTMCVPYESPTSHQASYSMTPQFQPQQSMLYHQTPTPQHGVPSYYEQPPPTTPQTMRYQSQTPAQHQLYYGVPGFYTPSFGSSYGEPTMPQSSHEVPMCDDMFMADVATTPRSRPSTPRRPQQQQQQLQTAPPTTLSSPELPAQLSMSKNVLRKRSSTERTLSGTEGQIHNEELTPKKQPRFTMEESTTGRDVKTKNRVQRPAAPALHIFSGSVQRVIKWEGLRDLFPVLFEVIAPLKAMRRADTHQELLLRDEAGPVLQVLFYEIDREMPKFLPGQLVRTVGRLISRTRLQAFSVRAATDLERVSLQRISFVCHRAVSQLPQPPVV